MKTVRHLLPESSFTCFVIDSLLSAEECDQLLSDDLKNSFQKANENYPTNYRNNERFVTDNPELASHLFEKIRTYVPEIITTDSDIESENGTWTLSQLNHRLRFCRYSVNQYFNRHLDGIHYRSETEQSKLTFMIYLNGDEEFGGGRTLFYKTKESPDIWASYIPRKGDLIVFDHNVWHEGEALSSGQKFVLRSDILYTRKNQEPVSTPFHGHLGYIWKILRLTPGTILSAGRDRSIHAWNENGELIHTMSGHENSILCLSKVNDHSFLSGSRDRTVRLWKRKDPGAPFEISATFQNHRATVLSVCWLGENLFASSGGDNCIYINDLVMGKFRTLNGHTDWVWQVVRIDDDHLASCSEDGTIKLWNFREGNTIDTITENGAVISICYHERTCTLISGTVHGELVIRKLDSGMRTTVVNRWKAHTGILRTILVLDESHLATGGEDNKVRIWDASTGACLKEMQHHNFVQSLELNGSGTILSASYDGTIRSWNY